MFAAVARRTKIKMEEWVSGIIRIPEDKWSWLEIAPGKSMSSDPPAFIIYYYSNSIVF